MTIATNGNISVNPATVARSWAIFGAAATIIAFIAVATWTVNEMLHQRDDRIKQLEQTTATHVTKEQVTESIMMALSRMTIQCDKTGDESTCKTWFSPSAATGRP